MQPERTLLAWRRTTLTAACAALLCLRVWSEQPTGAAAAVVAFSAMTAITLCTAMAVRTRRYRLRHDDPALAPFITTIALAVTATGISILLSLWLAAR